MTDQQISRLFQVCEEIAALKNSLAEVPEGADARHYTPILAAHQALLDELRSLLWVAGDGENG